MYSQIQAREEQGLGKSFFSSSEIFPWKVVSKMKKLKKICEICLFRVYNRIYNMMEAKLCWKLRYLKAAYNPKYRLEVFNYQ